MGVSEEYAKEQIDKFNEYYYSDKCERDHYGGPATMRSYQCWCPNPSYRELNQHDVVPDGITIRPIVYKRGI